MKAAQPFATLLTTTLHPPIGRTFNRRRRSRPGVSALVALMVSGRQQQSGIMVDKRDCSAGLLNSEILLAWATDAAAYLAGKN